MLHRAIDSPRKIVWLEKRKSAAWGCSQCTWSFLPIPIAVGNSFDLMAAHIQKQLETEFASHDCSQHPTAKGPRLERKVSILRKTPQPPLSRPGGAADSDRSTRPSLSEPDNREEKEVGDRVEGLGDFGKATGEMGTVKNTNEEDAIVKWDDDGRTRRLQSSLKKV
jgi:hypothetical protein